MSKIDSVFRVLLRYNFDLFRGNESIVSYVEDHLSWYYKDIVGAVEDENAFLGADFVQALKDKMSVLKQVCDEIPAVLGSFDDGYIREAHEKSNSLFNTVKPYLYRRYSWAGDSGQFYRIRPGDFRIKDKANSKAQKMELFHIRKEKRHLIGAYRYSIAGYPCLYLASDDRLAWLECGMPKQFSYCEMRVDVNDKDALELVDFSITPSDIYAVVTSRLDAARKNAGNHKAKQAAFNLLISYIITYPLRAACSVKVRNRGNKYIEEYIIPQLFMSWIRESRDIDGVCYKSSLYSTLPRSMGAYNVALPVKQFREDGLDERLAAKISVSDIGYLDVNKDFERYQDDLDVLKQYVDNLRCFAMEVSDAPECTYAIIELAECVIKTLEALMNGNYVNGELVFMHMNNLCNHAKLIHQNKDEMADESLAHISPHLQKTVTKESLATQIDLFYKFAQRILRYNAFMDLSFQSMDNFEHL